MFFLYIRKIIPLLAKTSRPLIVLPTVTKILERLMQGQLNEHINKFLSHFLCGYRTRFNVQTALLLLIKKWIIMLDNKGYTGTALMDLSKAFDTINYELLSLLTLLTHTHTHTHTYIYINIFIYIYIYIYMVYFV